MPSDLSAEVLPAVHRLVRKRAFKRNRSSDSSSPGDWCLPGAKYAHIYGRYVVDVQSNTNHV